MPGVQLATLSHRCAQGGAHRQKHGYGVTFAGSSGVSSPPPARSLHGLGLVGFSSCCCTWRSTPSAPPCWYGQPAAGVVAGSPRSTSRIAGLVAEQGWARGRGTYRRRSSRSRACRVRALFGIAVRTASLGTTSILLKECNRCARRSSGRESCADPMTALARCLASCRCRCQRARGLSCSARWRWGLANCDVTLVTSRVPPATRWCSRPAGGNRGAALARPRPAASPTPLIAVLFRSS